MAADDAAPACVATFGAAASFALTKKAMRARGASAKLLQELDASAYRYFRSLGPEFASQTCAHFRDLRWHLPVIAVHGDAHLEQFVVTPTTYGLEDFDQAGYGPAVVDLVRYAASIHVACREASWNCNPNELVESYFRAYRDALDHPPKRQAPSVVERLRRQAAQESGAFLHWADSLMQPLSAAEMESFSRSFDEFVKLQADDRSKSSQFYRLVRVGGLQMGVGSALETKLLLRIEGPTAQPTDDVILEARSLTPPRGNECAWRPPHGGSLQAFMFMSILGQRMPHVYGFAAAPRPDAPEFWVQSWEPGYRELSVADVRASSELRELAEDAARQLAGHFWIHFPAQLRAQQRQAQLRAFDMVAERAQRLAAQLADEMIGEWKEYRRSQ
jgi:hypothetical protein